MDSSGAEDKALMRKTVCFSLSNWRSEPETAFPLLRGDPTGFDPTSKLVSANTPFSVKILLGHAVEQPAVCGFD